MAARGAPGQLPIPLRERDDARSSESSQSPADGVADQVGRLVNVDSSHDPGPMSLSGLDLDAEERRNLLRLLTLGDQLQDLSLPPRQARSEEHTSELQSRT